MYCDDPGLLNRQNEPACSTGKNLLLDEPGLLNSHGVQINPANFYDVHSAHSIIEFNTKIQKLFNQKIFLI